MNLRTSRPALFAALILLGTAASLAQQIAQQIAQQTPFPQPTPAQQLGINKDTSRHFGDAPADPGPLATDLSPALTPAAIDKATRKVADWQLTVAQPYFDRIWTWSVLYSGFMAASESTGDPKYRDAMAAMSKGFNYQLRNRTPNADDQSIAQTYLELYLEGGKQNPDMIAPTKADLDVVIDLPTLTAKDPRIPWWWCDALFMAPPVWARMYTATGDHRYIDYLNTQWSKTSDLLYDKDEHLYARDESYKTKRGPHGEKIFWSRGEGWVMGGIARTLDYLPQDDPRRPFYIRQLQEMSARVAQLQRKDGLWPASLLDPQDYPQPEISGSALFVYGMAWGVNHGVLDRAKYKPVIERAWRGILKNIYADGRLGNIEQTGAEPAYYLPSSSYTYGVGGYLLAAKELKAMVSKPSRKKADITTPTQTTAPATAVVSTDPAPDSGRTAHFDPPANLLPGVPTIWLVGDSTVRNGKGDGAHNQMGWGDEFAAYFDTTKVNIVNRAIGGRSSRTYITEGHWAEVLATLKPGDVVLVQFGHNDSGAPDEPTRARASLPGTGAETKEIENPIMKKHEVVHTFGWYLTEYVNETRAKGATPILCSLVPRKTWKDGRIVRSKDSYAGWTAQVAAATHTGFIDLNEITARKYDALGEAAVEPLFGDPHTHTTVAGAIINAESVVAGLKALPNDPLAADFSAQGQRIAAFSAN